MFYSPGDAMRMSLRSAMMLSQVQMAMCLRFWALAGFWPMPAPTQPSEVGPGQLPRPDLAASPPAPPAKSRAEASSAARKARSGRARTV